MRCSEYNLNPTFFVAVHTQNERTGWIHPQLFDFALRMKDDAVAAGIKLKLKSIGVASARTHDLKPQSIARTKTAEMFLESDCTHLLMIDNDTPPSYAGEPLNPFLMYRGIQAGYDIVAAAVITYKRGDMPFCLYRHTPEGPHHLRTLAGDEMRATDLPDGHPDRGLIWVDAAGTGMILCSRRVIEEMHPYCFRPHLRSSTWDEAFWDHYDSTGWPEDIFWTRRAKEKHGFAICADLLTTCSHFHTVDLLSMALDRSRHADAKAAEATKAGAATRWWRGAKGAGTTYPHGKATL